jgi:hypothetical protein
MTAHSQRPTESMADELLADLPVIAQLEKVLDALMAIAEQSVGDIGQVRKRYEDRRGNVHQDEALWESWSAGFVDWLIAEHPSSIAFCTSSKWRIDGHLIAAGHAAAIARSHRSLFEVTAMPSGRVELLDLLGGAAFSVCEPRSLAGVEVGDVAELRLLGLGDDIFFSKTFIYHPKAARHEIVARTRIVLDSNGSRSDAIDAMATLRAYVPRYRHLPPSRVYQMADKLSHL